MMNPQEPPEIQQIIDYIGYRKRESSQKSSVPYVNDEADKHLVDGLIHLADSVQLPEEFVSDLRNRIRIVANDPYTTKIPHYQKRVPMKVQRTVLFVASAVAMVMVLFVSITTPILATLGLDHVLPRITQESTTVNEITTHNMVIDNERIQDINNIGEWAGLTILQPLYLPQGCDFYEAIRLPQPDNGIILRYQTTEDESCLTIIQQTNSTLKYPAVADGSTTPITVKGQAGLYVDGAFVTTIEGAVTRPDSVVVEEGSTYEEALEGATGGEVETSWMQGFSPQIIFEYNEMVITVEAGSLPLSKDDLLKISESLQ